MTSAYPLDDPWTLSSAILLGAWASVTILYMFR